MTIPGETTLKIQVWDQDVIIDEMIGETQIDLEERYYDESYRHMVNQPVERRTLHLEGSKQESGYIDLWVEAFNKKERDRSRIPRLWDISSIPETEFELRVIIWEARDVPAVDLDDTTDIFVVVNLGSVEQGLEAKTDTHKHASRGFVNPS